MTSLRTTLLLPPALFTLLWGVCMLSGEPGSEVSLGVPFAVLAVLLAVTAANLEVVLIRPVRSLKQWVQRGCSEAPVARGAGELRDLAAGLRQLQDRMRDYDTRLAEETKHRQDLETSLRELEDRYALTVERANDGTWEWDIRSSVTQFSPRWKGMLGYLDSDLASIDDWKRLLHPDDRDAVMTRQELGQDRLSGRLFVFINR